MTLEDLDPLQLEMEAMLAATVAKKNSLEEEAKVLDNVDKYRSKSGGSKGGQVKKVRGAIQVNYCINGFNNLSPLSGSLLPGEAPFVLLRVQRQRQEVPLKQQRRLR